MSKKTFALLAAIAAATTAAGCASSRNLDATFSDFGANAEMKSALFADRDYDYSDVDLTVYEGRLMLTGTMRSERDREALLKNAWSVKGVKQVIDAMVIADKTSFGQGFEDTRIDQTLRTKLIADGGVVSGDYKIAVSGATVYLLGATRHEEQLKRVLQHASTTPGVEKVVTYVEVRDSVAMR
ncbi:MAG: BON domain-containing protein [Pseudomonadota bacterium]